MLSKDELCTLCKQAEAVLIGLRQHLGKIEEERREVMNNIIATQAILAMGKRTLGEPYDPSTVPFDL